MPNQSNFRSDITTKTDSRFFASRIIRFPEEGVLLEELPGSFGYKLTDNIEIHFYTATGNVLMMSTTVSVNDPDILKTHIVSYTDGTSKVYIRIDFTKLFEDKQLILIPGDYKMVLNFFSDELGSYYNKKLYIQEISPSKTEVQIGFTDNLDEVTIAKNQKAVEEFVPKRFTKAIAIGVAQKIFKSGIELDDVTEGVNYNNIVDNIAMAAIQQTQENTVDRWKRLGIEPEVREKINQFVSDLYETIVNEIVISEDEYIQETEFKNLIQVTIDDRIHLLRNVLSSKINIG